MNQLDMLQKIVFQKKYALMTVVLFTVVLLVLSITSSIFSPLSLTINSLADPVKVVLVILISLLISFNVVVLVSNSSKKYHAIQGETILGAILALFVTTCPVCLPAWIVVLGVTVSAGFLIDYSGIIALISIGILSIALYRLLSCASGKCEVKGHGKSN